MISLLDKPFYYLDNFQRVLDWLGERYSDLLVPDERAFLAHFPLLGQNAQALFVRMVMRKGLLFRASKLQYREIGSVSEAMAGLLAAGWVEADPELSLEQLFGLLQKAEIGAIFRLPAHEKAARKAEQLEALHASHPAPRRFSLWYEGAADVAYRFLQQPLCDRLRLLFFGNGRQDWSEFVLADLGVYRYENVELAPASRGFQSRHDIDTYLALQRCREHYFDHGQGLAALADLPGAQANPWLNSRRDKLLFQIGQDCEQQGRWDAAAALYRQGAYPGARARTVRVLEKAGAWDEAYALLLHARQAPENDSEIQQLARIEPRLRRRLGHRSAPHRSACAAPKLALALPWPAAPTRVEWVVRAHLDQPQAPVYYVENALINGLFGLLCWNAIFKPIPGAFFHPFHRGPADLSSADFYPRRHEDFAQCLAQLDTGEYRATIRANLVAKAGIQSPFLIWEALDGALIDLALHCIPAEHLKKWCLRILQDLRANRSGFPDLIQFWPLEQRYQMIEVKGPGDRLQDNQLRWIDYCAEHQMPISVCYLQWTDAPADTDVAGEVSTAANPADTDVVGAASCAADSANVTSASAISSSAASPPGEMP